MRRVVSYLLDMAILGAPWSAILGTFATPQSGNWISGLAVVAAVAMFASAGTIVLLIADVVLFLMRGRTLGMAATGLVAAKGRKWLALVLHALLFALTLPVAFVVLTTLKDAGVLSDDVATVLLPLIPLATLALDLVFLVGSRRRTLTDRISGLRVVRDPALPALKASLRQGANIIDWLAAASVGAPIVLGLGHRPILGVALGGLGGLIVFGALEVGLWRKTGATLGVRALAIPAPTSLPDVH